MPPNQIQPTQPGVVSPEQLPTIPTQLPPKPPAQKSSKLFYVLGGGVALLVIITVVVVLVAGSSKKPAPKSNTSANTQSVSLDPATALDVQQASDAISNHLNQTNDAQTLPATALDDKTIGL